MKKILLIFWLLICLNLQGKIDEQNYWILTQRLPNWAYKTFVELKLNESYLISDYINPFYLEADFNGDNELDISIVIIHKLTKQKGIIIIHQKINQPYILGAGIKFYNAGENFDWMDIWRIERGSNVDIVSDKIVTKNAMLFVEKSESASGFIYWDGKKYCWTQVSD